jgi:hypothetical protein
MGGNIWPKLSRRFERAEFFDLQADVVFKLKPYMVKFEPTTTYATKSSFGDLDCIYVPNQDFNIEMLKIIFGTEHIQKNGPCASFLYKELQVDLIRSTEREFAACVDYHNYSDYGNLRGKIVHKFGLKFGHDGLTLPVRSENHTLGTIVLSQDPVAVNQLFGFHPGKFETLEAMFEDVISSYFFSPKVFAWVQMNAAARIRDKKRTTYHAFLKYIEGKTFMHEQEFHKDKSAYLSWIFHNFPEAKPEYDALWARKEMLEAAAEKFNGHLVREWTGLNGIELGNIMTALRVTMTTEYVLNLSQDQIFNEVMAACKGSLATALIDAAAAIEAIHNIKDR